MKERLLRSGPVPSKRDPERPSGLHLSALVRAALKEAGLDNNYGTWPEERRLLAMQIGLAWEDWYGPRLDGVIYHPGSMLCDDVWFSPDAIDMDHLILHEFKTTSRMPRGQSPFRQLSWNLQVQGYLWCMSQMGLGEWTVAQLHVLYVGQPPAPVLEVWQAEYEAFEIRRTWKNVLEPMKPKAELEK